MNYANAYESWSLYDTVVIASNVESLFNGQGYYASYNDLGVPAEIPFFNVRNQSVGTQYCNLDSANKLPFVFHCYSIGIDFEAPLVTGQQELDANNNGPRQSNLWFQSELVKHAGFIFRVSQDEKLVNTCTLMPSGQGIAGWQTNVDTDGEAQAIGLSNAQSGSPEKGNRWKFAQPIQMPREVNFDGRLIFSPYAQDALRKMVGPNDWNPQPGVSGTSWPMASTIRVTLYGKREVQQRNALHYT